MSNYTTEEVQDAVEKIVRSSVRHPTGILGDRKIDTTFNDLQEAAAGCFILYFNAPFYTLLLGIKRLTDQLKSQESTVLSLIDAVVATDRLVTPISDLSPIANAKAALEELEAAVSSRDQGFPDIEKVPAYRRYVTNLNSFLDATGSNIRGKDQSTGAAAIVDTPAGARAKIPGLVKQLVAQHGELLRKVKLLAGAIEDFSSLNLPRIAAQGVISRAREVLSLHYENLAALDENSRLENLRAVTLDLLTQRPLVKKYGAAQAPSEFIATSGLASAFADETHLAIPAEKLSDYSGPYPILAASQFIRFTMDGGLPIDFPLPLGFVAELNGNAQEPFEITSSSNSLRILFGHIDTGGTTFDITLTTGTRTAAQVVAEINAGLGASSLQAEERFFPLRYSSPVVVTSLGGSNARFTILSGDLTQLGVVVGDELDILDGPDAGTTWVITAVALSGQSVDATGPGPVTPVPLPGATVEIGPAARALRLRDTDELGSLTLRRTLRLPADSPKPLTATFLGFYPGSEVRSRPVPASAVVDNIKSSTSQLTARLDFKATRYQGLGRSIPGDPTRVALTKMEGTGTASGGTTVVINTAYFYLEDSMQLTDRLIIRSSLTAADVGKEGEVIFVAGNTITVQFMSVITAGDIGFEVGPDVNFGFGDVLMIHTGSNTGRYVVGEDQGVKTDASFELVLETPLLASSDGGLAYYFTVSLGAENVVFASRNTTLLTSIKIENAGSSLGAEHFLHPSSLGQLILGFTNYIHFSDYPVGAVVGDVVQRYINQYNVVTDQFAIRALEPDLGVLTIDGKVSSNLSLSFDFGIPNPFGRIRIAQVANYVELQERCNTWLSRPQQQNAYFRELARLLNPIVINANPTAVMVNDASNHLKSLLALLSAQYAASFGSTTSDTLEFALDMYEAPAQEPVDVLLSSFRNKGADRAIDLLLEGQFSAFFNLDVDGVSYSGTLMKNMRDMARQDLPVRKFNRADTRGEKLIGSQPDQQDFEFSSDDADSPNAPDIPMAPDADSPGENI